ncbi:DUF456 domain-containing protein [Nocardia rhizosphaerae]|uniref:DUF456 domain-containing protein n=1 Tax=Nocardia rhizosphaerae TaxID=1691571 RepID=A0ABV8KZF2_9NOCA
MSVWGEVLVGLVILVGIIGVIVPILPGVILIFAAVAVWAFLTGGTTAWVVFAIATIALVLSGVVKYTWPGRRMREAGVSNKALLVGALFGIVGFFVIPVVGLFIGFVLGVYLAELYRLKTNELAWPATVHALKGVGLSMVVELFGALIAAGVWLAGVVIV